MHTCTCDIICQSLVFDTNPACFSANRTGVNWCFLCMLVGVCATVNAVLRVFICVCLSEGKLDRKKKKKKCFHSL